MCGKGACGLPGAPTVRTSSKRSGRSVCRAVMKRRRRDLWSVLISWGKFYYTGITISRGGVCPESVCERRGGVREGRELAVMGRKGGCPDLSS